MDSFMAMMAHSESFSTTDPSNLTDQELDCLKEAFSLFDADHDGEITVYELGRYFITSTCNYARYCYVHLLCITLRNEYMFSRAYIFRNNTT